jgi:hypothetical protein
MMDCTLDALLDRNAFPSRSKHQKYDSVGRVGAETRSRIDKVFSQQTKISVRLKDPSSKA